MMALVEVIQELVGFGTYKHLMGQCDKASPIQRLLDSDDGFRSVWEVVDDNR
jgi:hypothetical protein